jgi:hypothetical protein
VAARAVESLDPADASSETARTDPSAAVERVIAVTDAAASFEETPVDASIDSTVLDSELLLHRAKQGIPRHVIREAVVNVARRVPVSPAEIVLDGALRSFVLLRIPPCHLL